MTTRPLFPLFRVFSAEQVKDDGKYLLVYDNSIMRPSVVTKSDGSSSRMGFDLVSSDAFGLNAAYGDFEDEEWTFKKIDDNWYVGRDEKYIKLTSSNDMKIKATLETQGDALNIQESTGKFTFSTGSVVLNYNSRGLINGYATKPASFYIYEYVPEKAAQTVTGFEDKTVDYGTAYDYSGVTSDSGAAAIIKYYFGTTEIAKPANAGSYRVKIVFPATDGYLAYSAEKSLTINKISPAYTVPASLTAVFGDLLSNVTLPTGWAWDNGSQSVGNVGTNTFKANFTPADASNYNNVENVDVKVTVNKADATPATVTANKLTCDGAEQALVTVTGEAVGGEMRYTLGTDATTAPEDGWNTDVPAATNFGTYYVWYKVVADENHNGTIPACIEVTIDPDYTVQEVTGLSGTGKDEWTKGGEDGVVITIKDSGEDNSFDHFTGVKLDGQLLTKDVDYTATKGSTIVTLLPATLEKLSVGEHTVTVLFDNGEVGTDLTVKAANSGNPTSPQTGDNSHLGLWIALMILSPCALAATPFIGKKRRVFDR